MNTPKQYRYRGQCRADANTPGAVDVSPYGRGAWRLLEWFGPVFSSRLAAETWYHKKLGNKHPGEVFYDLKFINGRKPSWSIEEYTVDKEPTNMANGHCSMTTASDRINQCYSDSNGNIHATLERAIEAQLKIDEEEAEARRMAPLRAVVDAFNGRKRAMLWERRKSAQRDNLAGFHTEPSTIRISEVDHYRLFEDALNATGYVLVAKK